MDEWHTLHKPRRPRWFVLRRRCVCGLPWPCVDTRLQNVRHRYDQLRRNNGA